MAAWTPPLGSLLLLRYLMWRVRRASRVRRVLSYRCRWQPIRTERILLYQLPVIPRCGKVIRGAYHFWGMDDAGIFLSQRTGGGGAAALGATGERACVPAGSADREHARGDGARGSGAAGWVEPVGGLRVA